MLLGYKVGASVSGPVGQESDEASFWVRRVDQSSGTEQSFTTTAEVEELLEYLAALARYCLELENNPRIDVVSEVGGTATWVTDTETGQRFGIRTADLEGATQICIHAERPPTIGNWRME